MKSNFPTYKNAFSKHAKTTLNTQYGETGLKYGAIANWSTIFKICWLYFVKKLRPVETFYLSDHPTQLHYGIWDKPSIKGFSDSVRRATDLAFKELKINSKKNSKILHAGCGWGGTEVQLAKKHKNLKTVGVSIDEDQIQLSKELASLRKVDKKCSFKRANFLKLPNSWNNSFDGGLALESLCHVPEDQLEGLFLSLFKVLKKRSRLVVHDWFVIKEVSDSEKSDLIAFQRGWDMPGTPHLEVFCDAAKKAGFSVKKKNNLTKFILKSARDIYWRAAIFEPIVKFLQGSKNKQINHIGLSHPQMLDFVVTCKIQRKLFEDRTIEYYQLVFEK